MAAGDACALVATAPRAMPRTANLKQTLDELLARHGRRAGIRESPAAVAGDLLEGRRPGHEADRSRGLHPDGGEARPRPHDPARHGSGCSSSSSGSATARCVEADRRWSSATRTGWSATPPSGPWRTIPPRPPGEKLREALRGGRRSRPQGGADQRPGLPRRAPRAPSCWPASFARSDPEVASAAGPGPGQARDPRGDRGPEDGARSPPTVRSGSRSATPWRSAARGCCARGDTAGARSIAELLYQPDEPARLAGLEGPAEDLRRGHRGGHPRGPGRGDAARCQRGGGLRRRRRQQGNQATGRRAGQSLPPAAQVALLGALGARRDRAALPAVVAAAASTRSGREGRGAGRAGRRGRRLDRAAPGQGDPGRRRAGRHRPPQPRDRLRRRRRSGARRQHEEDGGPGPPRPAHRDPRQPPRLVGRAGAARGGRQRRRQRPPQGHLWPWATWPAPTTSRAMVRGLFKIHDAGERDEAGRAIAAVCSRIADEAKQADPVLAEYRKAPAAEQLVLLPVLGRIGGPTALALIREAVAGPGPGSPRRRLRGSLPLARSGRRRRPGEAGRDHHGQGSEDPRHPRAGPRGRSCRERVPTTPGSPS